MPTISNASIKKKIQGASDRAGMSEDELIAFIQSTTASAPYFLDFLRRALPDGSSASLPGDAGKAFDNWVRAIHARSTTSGSKSAKKLSALLSSGDMREFESKTRKAASKPKTRKAASKAKGLYPTFPASQISGSSELSRSKKRWNDAVARGSNPIKATTTRIKATKDGKKLRSINMMVADLLERGVKVTPMLNALEDAGAILGSRPLKPAASKPKTTRKAASKSKTRKAASKSKTTRRAASKPKTAKAPSGWKSTPVRANSWHKDVTINGYRTRLTIDYKKEALPPWVGTLRLLRPLRTLTIYGNTPQDAANKLMADVKSSRKRTSKPKTTRKPTTRKPTTRKAQHQAAAEAVVNQTVNAAVKRARARGLRGPMKIRFDLVVTKI